MIIDSASTVHPIIDWRQITLTMTGAAISLLPTPPAISSLVGSITTGVVTVTCEAAHQLVTGQFVDISETGDGRYCAVKTPVIVTSPTVFTYQLSQAVMNNTNFSTLITPDAGGTPVFAYRIVAQRAVFSAASGNGSAIAIGPNSSANAKSIPAGADFQIENPVESKFTLGNWYANGAAGLTATVLYV